MGKRGTYYVNVTAAKPADGSNADTVQVGFWPGTADGATPPETWEQAIQHGLNVANHLATLPFREGGGVIEIRVTTFQQNDDEDRLVERDLLDEFICDPERNPYLALIQRWWDSGFIQILQRCRHCALPATVTIEESDPTGKSACINYGYCPQHRPLETPR